MTFVSVHAHTIRANAKHGRNDPAHSHCPHQVGQQAALCPRDQAGGQVTGIYLPDCPLLKRGARMVIKADDVKIIR
jgi:hypothetical protein